jgi:hypothetical protein
MRSGDRRRALKLAAAPCGRCGRESAFLSGLSLCPFCRGEDLERRHGLRPGTFRALASLPEPRCLPQPSARRPVPRVRANVV